MSSIPSVTASLSSNDGVSPETPNVLSVSPSPTYAYAPVTAILLALTRSYAPTTATGLVSTLTLSRPSPPAATNAKPSDTTTSFASAGTSPGPPRCATTSALTLRSHAGAEAANTSSWLATSTAESSTRPAPPGLPILLITMMPPP